MARVTLTISGRGETWQAELDPRGTVIGRSPQRDVVLESRQVSRKHVRVFQDPFDRWIFEDLGSSNGTFVNGKRIEARAVLPGERVVIGPFCLSIAQFFEQQIEPDDAVQATNIVIEDFETEIFYDETKQHETSRRPCPKRLDEITELLSELTSPAALYPELCRCLAGMPKTVALVLRLPGKTVPLPQAPKVLACSFGDSPEDTKAMDQPGLYPALPVILNLAAYRVSHHVLEEVRSKGHAAMAKSIYSSDEEITSALIDEHTPRALICAPLGDLKETVDVLYLDIPIDESIQATPEEMFDFVRAVAREVLSKRKSLTLMQVKAEWSGLNHELSLAQQVQSRLAPTIPEDLSGADIAIYYKPVMWVGGDYCDVWRIQDGRLAFAIADISEKGLPAAMAISNLKTLLRTTTSFCTSPSDIVNNVNSHLIQSLPEGTSVTLFLGLFDLSKGTLQYVSAGHIQPLLIQSQSNVQPLAQPESSPLGSGKLTLATGVEIIQDTTRLTVFTDGLTETKSSGGERFGVKRLMHLLKNVGRQPAQHIVDSVAEAVTDFRQNLAQQDDITIFALAYRKTGSGKINSKSEYQNPKQIQTTNYQNFKQQQ